MVRGSHDATCGLLSLSSLKVSCVCSLDEHIPGAECVKCVVEDVKYVVVVERYRRRHCCQKMSWSNDAIAVMFVTPIYPSNDVKKSE